MVLWYVVLWYFLVFSNLYFEHFNGFYPETFLYMEEDILALRIMRRSLHTLFYPSIIVFHKEGAATKIINTVKRERMEFIYSNRLKSQKIYQRLLRDADGVDL